MPATFPTIQISLAVIPTARQSAAKYMQPLLDAATVNVYKVFSVLDAASLMAYKGFECLQLLY